MKDHRSCTRLAPTGERPGEEARAVGSCTRACRPLKHRDASRATVRFLCCCCEALDTVFQCMVFLCISGIGISMKHPCRNFGASLSGLGLFCGLAHASASLHRYYSVHETFYQSSLVDKATRLISSLIGSIRFFWPGFFGQSRSYRLASALYSSSPTKRTLIVRPPKKRPFRSAIARCAASTLLSSM